MKDVYIAGVHTVRFGNYLHKSIKDLAADTVIPCLKDAGMPKESVQALWFANSAWGTAKGQACIRGQVALRPIGIESIPITNVENACAGGSTAFHHAWLGVASGLYKITMAVGAEKINHENKFAMFMGFLTGLDVEDLGNIIPQISEYGMTGDEKKLMQEHLQKYAHLQGTDTKKRKRRKTIKQKVRDLNNVYKAFLVLKMWLGQDTVKQLRKMLSSDHSAFMDVYGYSARQHMKKYGSTPEQLAVIASKNHFHSSLNPNAQYNFTITPEQVLADRMVSWPITRSMCAPIGDGAASAVLCDEETVARLGLSSRAVRVRASVLGSGRDRDFEDTDIGERLSRLAYEQAGLGPEDIDLAEVHDATAFGELHQTEALGFCPEGEGGALAERGATRIGGSIPVNPSGGLESRGHPIGASGLAQIHELVTQLRGAAGKRQVEGARTALAENGGGALGLEEAAMCIHILEAPR